MGFRGRLPGIDAGGCSKRGYGLDQTAMFIDVAQAGIRFDQCLPFGADRRFKVGCATINVQKPANQSLSG